jgi:hypothetical protein
MSDKVEFNFLDCVDKPEEPAPTNAEEGHKKKTTKPKKKTTKAKVEEEQNQLEQNQLEQNDGDDDNKNITTEDEKIKKSAETKQTLIMTLLRYQDSTRFKEYLKKNGFTYKAEQLEKKDSKQLKDLLTRVKFCLSNRGAGSFLDEMLRGGLTAAEALISTKTKYKITGMTEICFSDDEWCDCYELVKLEYLSFGYVRPELRLLLSTFRIASACHVLNTDDRFKHMKPQEQERQPERNQQTEPEKGVSVKGIKKSTSNTIGRSSSLAEPSFDD